MSTAEVVDIVKGSGLAPDVQMAIFITLIVLSVAAPIAFWLFSTNKRRVADGKAADAEGGFYDHLSAQVAVLTQRLDEVHNQYNILYKENAILNARIIKLESCEEMLAALQVVLKDKDALLMQRETQINVLFNDLRLRDQKIIELQDRLNVLEMRLARDENHWNEERDDLK